MPDVAVLDHGEPARRPRRFGWWWLGLVMAAATAYAGLAWFTTTRLPAGTTIGGAAVGGLGRDAAVAALRERLAPAAAARLTLRAGDKTTNPTPAELGLRLDYRDSVDPLLSFTLDPRTVLARLREGTEHPVAVDVSRAGLRTRLLADAQALRTEPVDGTVAFADGKLVRTEPVTGKDVDVDKASDLLMRSWPTTTELDVPVTDEPPTIDTADLDWFADTFAGPATAGPVTVVVGGKPVALDPAAITGTVKVDVVDGGLAANVDGAAVASALLAPGTGVGAAAQDARFEFVGGAPSIVPAKNGVNLDPAAAAAALQQAITAPDRTVTLETTSSEPKITTAALEGAGVKEAVSEFATPLTDNPGRTENIRIAAGVVNGTYLAPGQTFSLNDKLGRRTAGKGYNEAPVISGGRLTMGTGGGVSQVATTLFNGMFFAGLKDVQHKPHSFYISRYPEGREATVNYPSVDLKFTNDSPHGVLIQMWLADGKVHTKFWSTTVWDVTAAKGERTNIKQPRTIRDSSPGCVSQAPQSGFNVVVTRIFSQGGAEKKRETFKTTYIPEDRVICS